MSSRINKQIVLQLLSGILHSSKMGNKTTNAHNNVDESQNYYE